MGYYTDFSLSVYGSASDEAMKALKAASGYSWDDHQLYNSTWYDWDDHLSNVSASFPDVLFILDGAGEENPDLWRAWAMGGEVEQVIATITANQPDWVTGEHSLNRKADRS